MHDSLEAPICVGYTPRFAGKPRVSIWPTDIRKIPAPDTERNY
ncbi:hypothetical protein [Azohydromonas australica]|nr:hypothetical protein [Azohydromonas australica]